MKGGSAFTGCLDSVYASLGIKHLQERSLSYCGQTQRDLTPDQIDVMKQIAEFIVNDGAITVTDLNEINTNLWRQGIRTFGQVLRFSEEITALSRILLKAA